MGSRPEEETMRLHGPVLVAPGTVIKADGPNTPEYPVAPFTAPTLSWFFWLDEDPKAGFVHPVKFITLDANDVSAGFEEAGCDKWHMHALSAEGIKIDGKGPMPDPQKTSCGYGLVIQPPYPLSGWGTEYRKQRPFPRNPRERTDGGKKQDTGWNV
jgi:hypothetical protein